MDYNIIQTIDKVFLEVPITQNEKQTIVGAYTVHYYKALLEHYFTLSQKDLSLLSRLDNFFTEFFNQLDKDQREKLEEVIKIQKGIIFNDVIKKVENQLSPEKARIVKNNMARIRGEEFASKQVVK